MNVNLSTKDLEQLRLRGYPSGEFERMVSGFIDSTQHWRLDRPCTAGDGIMVLSAAEANRLVNLYQREGASYSKLKFVPASGAASRMFKHLKSLDKNEVGESTEEFILNFSRFPFFEVLKNKLSSHNVNLNELIERDQWHEIFSFILSNDGLNYDSQLKGMVIFHKNGEETRTAFDEHIHEAMAYAKQSDGRCRIHFTLAPQNTRWVEEYFQTKLKALPYEHIEITYSEQGIDTDTPALTKANDLYRSPNGDLLFRPGGHGSLISNIAKLDADIIFIKNIDNVCGEHLFPETVFYKQVLAGLLIELRKQIDYYLEVLELGRMVDIESALEFIQVWFQPGIPYGVGEKELLNFAKQRLDRPLRVCGMVRNEGEPGGGPFWIRMPGGYLTKQIAEKSQLDLDDVQQARIFANATHFNPVDIVCSIRNRQNENYDLSQFIDRTSGFVAEKFHEGHVIKALEHPGLWNGSMAYWNTVFVEVPISTFNPVKTVNDLLRAGHQEAPPSLV
jgi:hypothetical protein